MAFLSQCNEQKNPTRSLQKRLRLVLELVAKGTIQFQSGVVERIASNEKAQHLYDNQCANLENKDDAG